MRRTDRQTRRRGFTAIELLVAAAIGAVLLMIVGMAFSQVTTSVGLSRARGECYQKFRVISSVLNQELDGLVLDRTSTNLALNAVTADAHNIRDIGGAWIYDETAQNAWELFHDRLIFRTTSPLNAFENGHTCVVAYYLEQVDPQWNTVSGYSDVPPENTFQLVRRLIWSPDPGFAAMSDEEKTEVLATHVVGFKVEYWDDANKTWKHGNIGPTAGGQPVELPRLIRLRIDIVDEMGQIIEHDRAPLTFVIEKAVDRPFMVEPGDGSDRAMYY